MKDIAKQNQSINSLLPKNICKELQYKNGGHTCERLLTWSEVGEPTLVQSRPWRQEDTGLKSKSQGRKLHL